MRPDLSAFLIIDGRDGDMLLIDYSLSSNFIPYLPSCDYKIKASIEEMFKTARSSCDFYNRMGKFELLTTFDKTYKNKSVRFYVLKLTDNKIVPVISTNNKCGFVISNLLLNRELSWLESNEKKIINNLVT
jgi:hypothetical protein